MTPWQNVRPHGDRLILRIDPEERVTDAGLHLGAGRIERERLLWGTVEAVGKNVRDLRVGDRTLVHKASSYLELSERPEVIVVREEQCAITAPPGTEEPKQ